MTAPHRLVVKIRSDWQIGPFWVYRDEEAVPEPYLPEEISEVLPLEPELIAEIEAWDVSFQNTFRPDDPAESGFQDARQIQEFDARGRLLAHKVKAAIPADVTVRYVPLAGDGTEEITG
ncbi:hypothetical protein [Goodfellowiella coeruleoviolacea]|uniref:Uncharacterized protein n=1 Tax=Goodfellowiella coeruleoviolacea TaxID=334858 RepID=A0AAE3KJW5_9PSEU|nr:hypothetical protein [Goodfellowiella coeruleoviolacea]MCP2168754.1 hypothetical protein [Goodfellowiella coeruleoviolacea]